MTDCMIAARRRAPRVLVEVRIEAAPRVLLFAADADDERRIDDWIDAHPDLADLLDRALELSAEMSP